MSSAQLHAILAVLAVAFLVERLVARRRPTLDQQARRPTGGASFEAVVKSLVFGTIALVNAVTLADELAHPDAIYPVGPALTALAVAVLVGYVATQGVLVVRWSRRRHAAGSTGPGSESGSAAP